MKKKICKLGLFYSHYQDLKASGISDSTIIKSGHRSATVDEIKHHFGSCPKGARSGLLLNYGSGSGKLYSRVKLFPKTGNDSCPRYFQKAGTACRLYLSQADRENLQDVNQPLLFVEGEKKADKANQEGILTVAIGGIWSGFDDKELIDDIKKLPLKGRKVFYTPDSDVWSDDRKDLLKAVFAFVRALEELGAQVMVVKLSSQNPGVKTGLDDYLLTHSAEDFHKLLSIDLDDPIFSELEDWYQVWRNKSKKRNNEDISPISLISPSLATSKTWPKSPPLGTLYGVAGDFVRLVDPATEADPIALYFQLLVVFGSYIGRSAYFIAEQDKHFANLFGVLVGETSKGRKGSSWSQVKKVFGFFEDDWLKNHLSSGLSSGEGIIWAVRDAIKKTEPIKEKGQITGYQTVIADPGVEDKRLIVYEPEFASVLRVLEREGNTLSSQIRQAWESGTLRTLTKNSPAQATNAHISILGHITRDELRRYLNLTEAASGFGNRFLWFCVRRSKCLPEGGSYDLSKMVKLVSRLKSAIKFASKVESMQRSEKARGYWKEIYPALSEGKPGMLGAVTSRAEAQVMRLSCLFALLDQSHIIDIQHLQAAVALWDFAYQSAEYIFGDTIGDDVADRIYFELLNGNPEGMTLSKISALFNNHKSKERIHSAIQALISLGMVSWEEVQTGGRKAKVIKAIHKEEARPC